MTSEEDTTEVEIHTFDFGIPFRMGRLTKDYEVGSARGMPLVVSGYDQRYIPYLAECIRELPKNNFNCTVLITGERRTGKSTLALQLAHEVDPVHFKAEDIAFRLEDFNNTIKNNPTADPKNNLYPQVILDEAGYDMFALDWMERVQKNLIKELQVIGARKQILYLVLPHRDLLNNKVREEPINFWIHVVAPQHRRGIAELYRGMPNKWHTNKYWKPECSFTFGAYSDPIWYSYEAKKSAFITEVLAEKEIKKTSARYTELNRQRKILARALASTQEKKTHEEIADMIGMSQSSLTRLINGDA